MEQRIRERFSEAILDQAREAFGIKPGDIQELGGFESFIYQFQRGQEKGILRIAHSIHRSLNMIQGELDWINFLKTGGASVAAALPSVNTNWVEEIKDGEGGSFIVSAFEFAPGGTHRGEWPEKLLFEYGRQIGIMHRLSTSYQPSNPDWKRAEWDDPIHLDVEQFIPEKDHKIKQLYNEIIKETQELPRGIASYGLIHEDAHPGNFFVDENGKITIFDFDDCSYSWFVEDIALVLFYAVMGQEDPAGFTDKFLSGFMPGYHSEYELESRWFPEIPLFMKRREIDLYAVIHRSFDVENLDDPWCVWYLDGRKERIENRVPYLDFDFTDVDLEEYR